MPEMPLLVDSTQLQLSKQLKVYLHFVGSLKRQLQVLHLL